MSLGRIVVVIAIFIFGITIALGFLKAELERAHSQEVTYLKELYQRDENLAIGQIKLMTTACTNDKAPKNVPPVITELMASTLAAVARDQNSHGDMDAFRGHIHRLMRLELENFGSQLVQVPENEKALSSGVLKKFADKPYRLVMCVVRRIQKTS